MLQRLGIAAFALLLAPGCLPDRGTMPAQTFRPEEPNAACTAAELADTHGKYWTAEDRRVLDERIADGEPAVASVLGCHVDVLGDCHALGHEDEHGEMLAKDLSGPCALATHVVRGGKFGHVTYERLSLGDYRLTGTFRGVMRQPHGPFEIYDTTMYLAQDGSRVSGITRINTQVHDYWGDFRFEGRIEGNILFFADAAVLDDNLNIFLDWCRKGGYLVVDPRDGHLSGPWRASWCDPGTIDVRQIEDRPHVILPLADGQ